DDGILLHARRHADAATALWPAGRDRAVGNHALDVDVTGIRALIGPCDEGASESVGHDRAEGSVIRTLSSGERRGRGERHACVAGPTPSDGARGGDAQDSD